MESNPPENPTNNIFSGAFNPYLHKNLFTTVDIAQLGILHNNSECLEKIKIKINRKNFII